MTAHQCPDCGTETQYQPYTAGREYYCPTCDTTGTYPEDQQPIAALLQTRTGRIALRARMDQELARRCDLHPRNKQ